MSNTINKDVFNEIKKAGEFATEKDIKVQIIEWQMEIDTLISKIVAYQSILCERSTQVSLAKAQEAKNATQIFDKGFENMKAAGFDTKKAARLASQVNDLMEDL